MEVVFSAETDREAGPNLRLVMNAVSKMMINCELISYLKELDIKIRYIPIVMNSEISDRYPSRSKLYTKKRIYDICPQLDHTTFQSGSWDNQIRIFLNGLRDGSNRLHELGVSDIQLRIFLDAIDAIETHLRETGTPKHAEAASVVSPDPPMSALFEQEIVRGFAAMKRKDAEVDRGIMKIEHARKRVELLRQTAESKSHLGDKYGEDAPPYYRNYRSNTESAAFEALGPTSEDAAVRAIQSAAYESVAQLAEGFGLDPEATRARFSGEQVSIGLGQDFRKTELKERAESRARRGKTTETKKEANDCIEEFHRQARVIFEDAKTKIKLIL